jgi:anhydro-N-acetylmuramic acid kinase
MCTHALKDVFGHGFGHALSSSSYLLVAPPSETDLAPPYSHTRTHSHTQKNADACIHGHGQAILELQDPRRAVTLRELGRADVLVGQRLGEAANSVCRGQRDGARVIEVDVVASHGQTIHHDPEGHSTTQIGQPAVIAALTGATVVADFRVADMAHGGQGAPLTSTFDWLMLRPPRGVGVRALQNIGGIANVTFVTEARADGMMDSGTSPVAFDTGPGNCLIDLAAAAADPALTCDRDGLLAAEGRVSEELLDVMLQHPYFARPAPKTTGREEFSSELFERWRADAEARGCSPNDFVATVTELTARSIARAYHLAPPELSHALTEVVVSGGGGKNPQLMARLVAALRREFCKDVAVRGHADVLSELVEPGALPAGLTVDDAKEALVSHSRASLHAKP